MTTAALITPGERRGGEIAATRGKERGAKRRPRTEEDEGTT